MDQQESKNAQTMEKILQAIQEITKAQVKSLSYDKTIKAIIINADQASRGIYEVSQIGAEKTGSFTACSGSTTYKQGESVYVTIPEGDMTSNNKIIIGKYTNTDESYYTYLNPLDSFLDITGNLVQTTEKGPWVLTANYADISSLLIWEQNGLSLKGYNRLALQADFKTWLQSLDIMSGSYGLVLTVEDATGKLINFKLTTDEMYGNPYYFETFYRQQVLLDIENIEEIRAMYLNFIQCNDFYTSTGTKAISLDEDGQKIPDNIFMKTPYISVGYDISEFDGDDLRIFTDNVQSFDSGSPSESRTITAQWVHVEDNKSAVVINSIDEMPVNPKYDGTSSGLALFPIPETEADLHWFEYKTPVADTHFMAGKGWVDLGENALNNFTYQFNTPTGDATGGEANKLPYLKYKAIVSYPSLRYINYSFTQTEEYNKILDNVDKGPGGEDLNVEIYNECLNLFHSIMKGEKNISDGKTLIQNKYKDITSETYNNFLTALNNYRTLRSEMKLVYSAEITFPNTGYDPAKYFEGDIADFNIEVDPEDLKGTYLIYDDNGYIIDISQASKVRYFRASYTTLAETINEDDTSVEDIAYEKDEAERLTWYIPLDNTMIATPVSGEEYGPTDEVIPEYEVTLQSSEDGTVEPGRYCKISRIPLLDETIVDKEQLIAEHKMFQEQKFRIKDYYSQMETNNNVYCRVTKKSKHYFTSAKLDFGVSGTNGTEATFTLKMYEVNDDGTISDTQASALSTKTVYYDYDNNGVTVKLTGDRSGKIAIVPELRDYNGKVIEDYFKNNEVTYKFNPGLEQYSPFTITNVASNKGSIIVGWTAMPDKLDSPTEAEKNAGKKDYDYYLVIEAEVPYQIIYNYLTYTATTDVSDATYLSQEMKDAGKKVGDYILDDKGNKQPILDAQGNPTSRADTLKTYLPISIIKNKLLHKVTAPYDPTATTDNGEKIPPAEGAGAEAPDLNKYYTQIVGANKVIYDRNGSNAKYYKNSYQLLNGKYDVIEDLAWRVKIKAEDEEDDANAKLSIRSFYPSVTPSGTLQPLEMYILSGTQPNFCVQGGIPERNEDGSIKVDSKEQPILKEVLCVQPVLIIQNKYGSPMLNKWSGGLTIDEKNGTILASMVGAGIKDVNNTFSGVLMGDVSQAYKDNHNGLGLYGFHQNDQSFGFNINGSAFIGKSGHGRIWFDGNNGTITSGTFSDGSEKYNNRPQQGMQIDLDGTDSISSSIHAFGPNGGFVLDLGQQDDNTPVTFKVFTGPYNTPYVPVTDEDEELQPYERGMIYFDKDGQYIQSLNYNGFYKGQIPPSGLASQKLPPGLLNRPTGLIEEDIDTPAETGMFIDLRNGWIDARSGIIGGWKIEPYRLASMNDEIVLWAGDPKDSNNNIPYIRIGKIAEEDEAGNADMEGKVWLAGYQLLGQTYNDTISFANDLTKTNVTLSITTGENSDSWGNWDSGALTDLTFKLSSGKIVNFSNTTNSWVLFDGALVDYNPGIKLRSSLVQEDEDSIKSLILLNPYSSDGGFSSLGTEGEPWGSAYTKNGFYFKEKLEFEEDGEEKTVEGWHLCATQEWVKSIIVPNLNERIRQVSYTAWSALKKANDAIDDIATWCEACDGQVFLSSVNNTVSVGDGTIEITFNTGTFSAGRTDSGGITGSMGVDGGTQKVVIPTYSATDINNWEKVLSEQINDIKARLTALESHTHTYTAPSAHSHSIEAGATTTKLGGATTTKSTSTPNTGS